MDLIKIEDTPNEQSLVFIAPNYIRKHALSVIVALYQQWMIEGISFDCGTWIEESAKGLGINCEYLRAEKWERNCEEDKKAMLFRK